MRIFSGLLILAGVLAQAQSGCPPVAFQTAIPIAKPSNSSHLMFVRQSDGSYTAYEMEDAPPYRVLHVTPNFGATLARCLPAPPPLSPLPPPTGSGVVTGMASQEIIFARLASGAFLQVQSSGQAIDFAVFAPDMTLLSDTQYPRTGVEFDLADVNGDGELDLIATEFRGKQEQGVLVFPGNGDGTFQNPVETLVPGTDAIARPGWFAVADVDGDGKPDLVMSLSNPDATAPVVLMQGNGDGTFANPVQLFLADWPARVALADLNGDGKQDIIVTAGELAFQNVLVALGQGGGTFANPVVYPVAGGDAPWVGDMSGDGAPDIVAGGSILFGDGTGAFPHRANYADAGSGVVADIDGDGRLDVIGGVSGNPWIFSGVNGASVLLGASDGVFRGTPIGLAVDVSATATADFDGDGFPDIAVFDDGGNLTVQKGSGTAFETVFQYQLPSDLTGLALAVVAADFNRDGRIDLAVAVQNDTQMLSRVLILPGNGDGTFQKPGKLLLPAGLNIASLAAADFDRDGNKDLAVVVNTFNEGAADEVLVYRGNGNGTFQTARTHPLGTGATAIVTGDFNGDGKIDIATADRGPYPDSNAAISILPGNGDGTFGKTIAVDVRGVLNSIPGALAAADFDGDGNMDFAVPVADFTTGAQSIAVVLGKGNGTFGAPSYWPVSGSGVGTADLNGDGIPDLIEAAGYRLGNGDGTFAAEAQIEGGVPFVVGHTDRVLVGDFDRDGRLDVVFNRSEGEVLYLNRSPALTPVRGRRHWTDGDSR